MELKGLLLRHKRFLLTLQVKSFRFFTLTMAAYQDSIFIFGRNTLATLRNKNPVETKAWKSFFQYPSLEWVTKCAQRNIWVETQDVLQPFTQPPEQTLAWSLCVSVEPCPRNWMRRRSRTGGAVWLSRTGAGAGSLPECWGLALLSWHSTG